MDQSTHLTSAAQLINILLPEAGFHLPVGGMPSEGSLTNTSAFFGIAVSAIRAIVCGYLLAWGRRNVAAISNKVNKSESTLLLVAIKQTPADNPGLFPSAYYHW
jgi:hypothetical protein